MRFSSATDGMVTGVRFFQGPKNRGTHIGRLWSSSGKKLAEVTFAPTSSVGWKEANFASPVPIKAGVSYTISYLAPHGGYSEDDGYFSRARNVGDLAVPAHGGVYRYPGGFPTAVWRDANYFVDVLFRPGGTSSSPSGTPASTSTSTPSQTAAPSETSPPSGTPAPSSGGSKNALDLPRIPWEGGPAYWAQFPKAAAAGWTDPSFFPVAIAVDSVSSDDEVQYDKSVGINTYAGGWEGTPYSLYGDNDVFWIGDAINSSFNDSSKNWVGDFLEDEVDGWSSSPTQGLQTLAKDYAARGNDGRFKWSNFSQMVIGGFLSGTDAQAYVNKYNDVVSMDQYYYSNGSCNAIPDQIEAYIVPIKIANCATSSSYGRSVDAMRIRDAADGKLQPIWNYIEDFNGGPGASAPAVYIQPAQLEGAVMNSIIHEARGIAYFNLSLSGDCRSGNVVRDAQLGDSCFQPQVAAMKHIDGFVRSLASVINTQSYQWNFGSGLDTMLKASDGYAYVFAMIDGNSTPGDRTFTLPAGITGTSAQVVGENRAISISGGKFADNFARESSYHVYKIALGR